MLLFVLVKLKLTLLVNKHIKLLLLVTNRILMTDTSRNVINVRISPLRMIYGMCQRVFLIRVRYMTKLNDLVRIKHVNN